MLTKPQNIKEGIEGHAVDWYSDVFDIVFPDVDTHKINLRWKDALKKTKEKAKKPKKKRDDEDDDGDDDDDDD